MKRNIKVIASLVIILCSMFLTANAQQFDLPTDVKLETKEDYTIYEKDIIAAANWLEATALGKEEEKRKAVNAFMMKWITGSPTVTIELYAGAVKIGDKDPDMLMMLMAGYSRYTLQNGYEKDKIKCFTAAIKSVINLYTLGGDVKKNKFIQKAVDADKEGKLEDWVKDNLLK